MSPNIFFSFQSQLLLSSKLFAVPSSRNFLGDNLNYLFYNIFDYFLLADEINIFSSFITRPKFNLFKIYYY